MLLNKLKISLRLIKFVKSYCMIKRSLSLFLVPSFLLFLSCEKSVEHAAPVGGNLPTTYVIIKDSSFKPSQISIVAGNSITFLNQTSKEQTIISFDSITIPATKIAANESFVFKKDTVGTFPYKNVTQTNAIGSFTLRP